MSSLVASSTPADAFPLGDRMSEDRRAIVVGGGIGDGCRKPVSADVACIASRKAACITGAFTCTEADAAD